MVNHSQCREGTSYLSPPSIGSKKRENTVISVIVLTAIIVLAYYSLNQSDNQPETIATPDSLTTSTNPQEILTVQKTTTLKTYQTTSTKPKTTTTYRATTISTTMIPLEEGKPLSGPWKTLFNAVLMDDARYCTTLSGGIRDECSDLFVAVSLSAKNKDSSFCLLKNMSLDGRPANQFCTSLVGKLGQMKVAGRPPT